MNAHSRSNDLKLRSLIAPLVGIGILFLIVLLIVPAIPVIWNNLGTIFIGLIVAIFVLGVLSRVPGMIRHVKEWRPSTAWLRSLLSQSESTSERETLTPAPATTGPAYNFRFAVVCVGVASLIFILTMLVFQDLIKAPADIAIVSGALGGLFTLIGTLAGAYFGIKSTQDTTEKARQQVEEAHERERAALGALDSNEWEKLRRARSL
jgi:hypothetical protein